MGPTLQEIAAAAKVLSGKAIKTPTLALTQARWGKILPDAEVVVKLELFQQTGSFKARGAYLGVDGLDDAGRRAGVVAASGGNHAMAVAWAAKRAGVDALIAMPKTTDPERVKGCKALGAAVILCEDMPAAFQVMKDESAKGRLMLHPFEGVHMTLGSGVLGLEYLNQAPDVDVFVVPVGGGGLISGMACAIKQAKPSAKIIGVEPVGADSMYRSLKAGAALTLAKIDTIADSLGAPMAMPYSFAVTAAHVDKVVHVTDTEMLDAMQHYGDILRIMSEPACAASLAAIIGPLREEIKGRNVGIIACGSNIGLDRYHQLMRT